ncbi:MFS transporter [Kitasatospora sp. NPDC088346]|uniref:MFS transporter n=1 Tax=Kitasatospora sp. NPDC088346 TaxID=3364073 RepID=UPI003816688E
MEQPVNDTTTATTTATAAATATAEPAAEPAAEPVIATTEPATTEPATTEPARRLGRDFHLLWFGESVSRLGTGISGIAMAMVAVTVLHASTFVVGVLGAAAWLPWLVVGLPAGAWTDRMQRRRTMLICDAVSLTLLASVPIAAWTGVLGLGQLVAVALGTGAASVFFTTSYQAYLPSLVAKPDLPAANARLQAGEQVAGIAGPGLGGLLVRLLGAVTGVLADAASFAVSAACLLGIRATETRPDRERRRTTLRRDIAEGMRFVVRDPYLRILTLCAAVDNLTLVASSTLYVVFLVRVAGVDPELIGLLIAADAVGGILGALVATRIGRRFGSAHGMLVAALVTAPFTLLIPLADDGPRLLLFVLGLSVPAAGLVVANVLSSGFRQAYVPAELLGRVFTSARFLQFGVIPVAALLGGALGSVLGVRESLWLTLSAGVLGKLLRLLGPLRRHRDFPTARA